MKITQIRPLFQKVAVTTDTRIIQVPVANGIETVSATDFAKQFGIDFMTYLNREVQVSPETVRKHARLVSNGLAWQVKESKMSGIILTSKAITLLIKQIASPGGFLDIKRATNSATYARMIINSFYKAVDFMANNLSRQYRISFEAASELRKILAAGKSKSY